MHSDWRDLKTPHERLQWARERAGFDSPTEAADAMGMEPPTYLGHENGHRGLSRAASRYADFYRVSLDWLLRGKGVPQAGMRSAPGPDGRTKNSRDPQEIRIIGRAGAGPEGSVHFDEETDLGTAPMPPGGTETTKALEVWGSSMRPMAYEGWLVYYDDRRGALTPDMLGQPCIIGLASGHTVIKTPFEGSKRGLYNLESANSAVDTMRDQRVKWAALVTAIVPRVPARNLIKRAKGEVRTVRQ